MIIFSAPILREVCRLPYSEEKDNRRVKECQVQKPDCVEIYLTSYLTRLFDERHGG